MAIQKDEAFRDMRNEAELLLAPRRPKSRSLVNTSSLKLDIGGTTKLPGVISDASQITGPLRKAFGSVLASKALVRTLASAVGKVLTAFDAQRAQLNAGQFIPPAPLLAGNTAPGEIPSTEKFLSFSTLAPGAPVPPEFSAQMDERKTQLQQLSRTFSSQSNQQGFGGVSIEENISPEGYPLTDDLDLPTLPRLAQGGAIGRNDQILKDKVKFAVKGVKIGSGKPSYWSRNATASSVLAAPNLNPLVNQFFRDRKNEGTWSEPVSAYNAQYPYNKVQQTESGHVIELDDTPGAERVHVFHRSGSFIEFHPNGSVVYKNMKDGYGVTMGDHYVKVNGRCAVAVDGATSVYVKGNVDLQTDGDFNVQAKGDFNVYAKNINLRAKKTSKLDGTKIDLRYTSLPGSLGFVSPMGGGPFMVPRINLAAIRSDFPDSNVDDVMNGSKSMQPSLTANPLSANGSPFSMPPENPLSNFSVYSSKTPQATLYRAHLFDTPEEVNDFEMYSGHVSLQETLEDSRPQDRQLGGTTRAITTGLTEPASKPSINYLDFDKDFKGKYDWDETTALGGTSFSIKELVDTSLYPDIVSDISGTGSVEGVPSDAVPKTPETGQTEKDYNVDYGIDFTNPLI